MTARLRPPWWACNGWWSPWCALDVLTRCRLSWICERHDCAVERRVVSEAGPW